MTKEAKNTFAYPFPPGETRPWSLGLTKRVALELSSFLRRRVSPRPNPATLNPISPAGFRPLDDADMPVVFMAHNDRRYLRSFFKHYRGIGATRFICVDDRSDDGTREFLLAQPDADVFESNVRFAEAARGKAWREMLFDLYGYDRWYVNVDSDEYFIYETIDSEPVRAFAERLQRGGVLRIPAVMIDTYPEGPLEDARFDGGDDTMPWEVATHFDGAGYTGGLGRKGLQIRGGFRPRLFQLFAELVKYPLIYWDRLCSMGRTIHFPLPAKHAFHPAVGCLIHCKVFSDLTDQIRSNIANGQHWRGGEHYREWLRRIDEGGLPGFKYEHSIAYRGPRDLIDRGFILPLRDRAA